MIEEKSIDAVIKDPAHENIVKAALTLLSSVMQSEEILRSTVDKNLLDAKEEAVALITMGLRFGLQSGLNIAETMLLVGQVLQQNFTQNNLKEQE